MKGIQKQVKGVKDNNFARETHKTADFSLKKGILCYFLLSKSWFPSLSLGLLTTVLGITGIVANANAKEQPEQPNPELSDVVQANQESIKSAAGRMNEEFLHASGEDFSSSEQPTLSNSTDADFVPASFAPKSERGEIGVGSSEFGWEKDRVHTPEFIPLRSNHLGRDKEKIGEETGRIESQTSPISQASGIEDGVNPTSVDKSTAQPESTSEGTGEAPEETEVGIQGLGVGNEFSPSTSSQPLTPAAQNNGLPASPDNILSSDQVRILTPQTGVTNQRSTNLVVQYNANAQIQVSVNENPLDPAIVTDQGRDETGELITQTWYNIPLEDGENTLTVQAGDGTPLSVQLTVKETTAKIEIFPVGNPQIPADDRSTITLQGRIVDENGELIAEDTIVTLTASAGEFVGADQDKDRPGFQVMARSGEFTAQLKSGLEAQKVRIRAAVDELNVERLNVEGLNNVQPSTLAQPSTPLEAYTQVEFLTYLRPSLATGVINLRIGEAGTNFWGSRRDFLDPDLIDDGTEVDLYGAVFATGKIGEWLFTGAYNSDRPLNETCDGTTRLFRGPQFCEQQYPVYGDDSTVDYLTPSQDSVYLRFERTSPVPGAEPDFFMWGDYHTQELARRSQLYTATSRTLHGFKGNYNLGNLQITALYSNDIEGFQRDTIAPDGTSGYYFLSQRILVPGSETIYIEKEELLRPGTVVERKRLVRGADYEIDYDRGTILFRRPISQTELSFFEPGTDSLTEDVGITLVNRIVATYQFENGNGDTNLYAGRVQYNFSQDFQSESWIAGTYLLEDQGSQDFELYGADLRLPLGANGELIAEYAHSSDNSLFLGDISGEAYRLEVNGNITPSIRLGAYYREVQEGFRNNATTSFTPGQTRYGATAAYQITPSTSFRVGYDFEENFGIAPEVRTGLVDLLDPGIEARPGSPVDNTLSTLRAGFQQRIGDAVFGVDYVNRERDDRIDDTFSGSASQIVSRLGVPLTPSLNFLAQNELNLDDSDPIYPNRTTFALDWAAYPGVTVRLAHQFFDGGLLGDDSLTSLDTIATHQLWDNTTITGRSSLIRTSNGFVGQGAIGLDHAWVITPGLKLRLGYEHTFSTASVETAAGEQFEQPYTVGQTAAALALLGGDVYRVGIEYSDNPNFLASASFEHRTGSGNDNTVITATAAGKLSPALTALVRFEQGNFANQLIEGLGNSATLKVGLAYRNPYSDRWNALLRYEYRKNPSTIPETLLLDSGIGSNEHVLSAEAIYAPSWRWEFYGKGAFRRSSTDLSEDFSNSSTIFLGQLRASYRLGYRMDLAVEGRWIGQDEPSFSETGFAVEAGYYVTPDLRVGVGYSFGSVDDRDFAGYRSEGGPYLSLTLKINELLGGFGRQRIVPPQQQESTVEPIAADENPDSEAAQFTAPASDTTNEVSK